jgi:hypothetical protein
MENSRLIFIGILVVLASTVAAQSITAPVLLLPQQGDTIRHTNPAFTWQAAYPASQLQYEFRLFEILGDQTPEAAVLSSPVLHAAFTGQATAYLYPFNAAELQAGHHYAWQVVAHPQAEGQNEAFSPVSHFYVSEKETEEPTPPETSIYFEPHAQSNQRTYELNTEWLPIVLDEKYKPSKIKFRLINDQQQEITIPDLDVSVDIRYGDNYVQLYVGKLQPGIYQAIVETRKSDMQYIRFRVTP